MKLDEYQDRYVSSVVQNTSLVRAESKFQSWYPFPKRNCIPWWTGGESDFGDVWEQGNSIGEIPE